MSVVNTATPAASSDDNGVHFELISNALPTWAKQASPKRLKALGEASKSIADWYRIRSPEQPLLKAAVAKHWETQNAVDKQLNKLQDIETFAEPLLKQALKQHYGVEEDVRNTYLKLYIPTGTPLSGVTSRSVSLLQAALHNFAAGDTFTNDSVFTTRPDAQGRYDVKHIKHRITVGQFKTLVRKLDIGALYSQHLEEQLGLKQPVVAGVLRARVILSQQAAFRAAIHSALLMGHIDHAMHSLLPGLIEGRADLTVNGLPVRCHDLLMMDTVLTGIVLIAPDLLRSRESAPLVVYIPDDPEHPLKQYPDTRAFVQELTRQLRQPDYQRFFCRFVPQASRGVFLTELQDRLSRVSWHSRQPLDPLPSWRDTPVDKPDVQLGARGLKQGLWSHLYQQQLDRLLNDSREIAVSTAYADRMARWAWWDNLEKILSDILNVALLIATPLVPVLGPLMLAYSAWQIADEIFEGLLDWAEDRSIEAIEHAVGAVQSLVQLGLFGIGSQLGELAKLRLSAFVDGLIAVRLPSGKQALWNPDLTPYRQKELAPAPTAKADKNGFHNVAGKKIMRLDAHHYEVTQDPDTGQHHVVHPERPEAYQPQVYTNGDGTLVHEGEQPLTWNTQRLMQRLSPVTAELAPAQLEQIREISGIGIDELRRIYVDNTELPPLLDDTLERVELRQDVDTLVARVRNGEPTGDADSWIAQLLTELPGWPAESAIDVFDAADLSGEPIRYGDTGAGLGHTLRISLEHVNAGRLPHQLVASLSEEELKGLLGSHLPAEPADRVQALRDQLADYLNTQKGVLFEHLYRNAQVTDDANGQLLQEQVPDLTGTLVQRLLSHARPSERQIMSQERRVPLRLKHLARELAFEIRATHACEGLYTNLPPSADTERLLLNALRVHSDTFGDLRISIHKGTANGPLRCAVGPGDASIARVLILQADGHYALAEAPRQTYDLYEAMLRVLPEDRRIALGYQTDDGRALEKWLKSKLLPPAERRTVLAQPPTPPVAQRETLLLLQRPRFKALRQLFSPGRSVEARIRRLYPRMTDSEVQSYAALMSTPEGLDTLKAFEAEKRALEEDLHEWLLSPTRSSNRRLADDERLFRIDVSAELRNCWERQPQHYKSEYGDRLFGLKLDLSGRAIEGNFELFPRLGADFGHVTSLDLTATDLLDIDAGFLHNFPNLSSLDLTANSLTELPAALSDMPGLTLLGLSDNPIRWTASSLTALKPLHHLRVLIMSSNPHLLVPPDIGHMPDLQVLMLNNTRIRDWPPGLFDVERPLGFVLNMRNTSVTRLPAVEPGSSQAQVVIRTQLDRRKLDFDSENLMVSLRRAHGLDPYRTYPARGATDSVFWLEDQPPEQKEHLQLVWNELEAEHGSQGFFEVIRSLHLEDIVFQVREDADLYRLNKAQLSANVLRMLKNMHVDDGLRERLFTMASAPFTCADAGAEIFNAMGIEVLVFEAHRDSTPQNLGPALARLAKQKSRLQQVNLIAQADVRHRITALEDGGLGQHLNTEVVDGLRGEVDEVQVYAAYQTALRERLELPWLASHMAYRTSAGVSPEQLDQACASVLALEQGDGLVDQMLQHNFWRDYLMETHPQAFRDNLSLHSDATSGVDDLRYAQKDWALDQKKPADQRDAQVSQQLFQQLALLADKMGVPHSVVLTGEEMSDATYLRLLGDSVRDEGELARRLTREVLSRLA
ncbi:dermonecrotic toxin domain-containing protein [Pseudomonas sp. AMR01]|uniref:dermonecrotic toxin domain-containing protein n=1 Tax=Pseudomonas sp. AMR01 TaxID=3064904 RepID=UPI0035C1A878